MLCRVVRLSFVIGRPRASLLCRIGDGLRVPFAVGTMALQAGRIEDVYRKRRRATFKTGGLNGAHFRAAAKENIYESVDVAMV